MPGVIDNAALRLAEPIVPQIINRLRQAIIELRLEPGQPLSEKEIALLYGVSRQPVREAFIKLAEAGLVQVLPSRGTYVTKISVKEVLNARFVREAIECAVVREAAGRIDKAGLARLEGFIEAQERAAAELDNVAFTELDEAFHRAIADCVDCDYAVRVVEAARAQTDRVRHLSLPEASPFPVLIQQHRDIVSALRQGDARAGEEAMRRHVREILSALPRLAAAHPAFFEDQASLAGL
ncbi:MAG: GntR family transcriptional regulator [Beijerinckiaceae bacterium]|jgi:DNA-binding GntR family transcriptional regulator|nr:GntR family transcriptional regulator [Beijerinckiaceae bacterium]